MIHLNTFNHRTVMGVKH